MYHFYRRGNAQQSCPQFLEKIAWAAELGTREALPDWMLASNQFDYGICDICDLRVKGVAHQARSKAGGDEMRTIHRM